MNCIFFYLYVVSTKTTNTNTMAMTLEMLVARVETLEKQYALLIKERDAKTKKEEKEDKEAKKEAKKEKKAKKSKDDTSSDDEGKPKKKRGTNGYILFSNANRDDVKAKLFGGDEKPKNTEIMKQLAELWQSTSAEEKEVWNAKAKEANDVN